MLRDHYHHGNLREALITNGLQQLHEHGAQHFSLRKVAMACGVSQTAAYKHFESKEELLRTISKRVLNDFENMLQGVADEYKHEFPKQTIEICKSYVKFMVENPDYLCFITNNKAIKEIQFQNHTFSPSKNRAFELFRESAYASLKQAHILNEKADITILELWSIVHDTTLLVAQKIIIMDDYESSIEEMITSKLSM